MARKRPTPTLHRFHPAAMNPVVVARPDNESAPGATPVNPNSQDLQLLNLNLLNLQLRRLIYKNIR